MRRGRSGQAPLKAAAPTGRMDFFMRRIHVILLCLFVLVFLIGYLEPRPSLSDFEAARDGEFRATWDKRVHLAYWEKWASFEAEACQAMVDDFNRGQDEIFVHYIRTSQVNRKAMLAILGNDPPDVVGLWNNDVPQFGAGEALMPLDDLMQKSGLTSDYYIPNYLELCRYKGKTWALPTAPSSVGLFYNKEHFRAKEKELRAAGCDPDRAPATIEELDRYAEVLSTFKADGSPLVMGFLATEPGWFNHAWGYYFGGSLYDEATGKVTTDDAANIRAYTWLKRQAEIYGREKLLRFRSGFGTFDSPENAFIAGKVSMVMQGVWFPNFIRRHRPQMEFGVAPFPCAEGVPGPRSILETDVIGIPRGSKHPEAAWKFIYYVQTRGLSILCRLQGKHMPVSRPPVEFRQGHPNLELEVFEKLSASPHSFIMPRITVWIEYQDEIRRAFEHVWNWPAPEGALAGLSGDARRLKVEELCRGEIERTLRAVRERMQEKLDRMAALDRLRDQREKR